MLNCGYMAYTREVITFWCHYNVLVNFCFLMPNVAGSSPYLVLNQFKRITIGFEKHCGKDGSYKVLFHQEVMFVYLATDAAAFTLDKLLHVPYTLSVLAEACHTPTTLFLQASTLRLCLPRFSFSYSIKLCKQLFANWGEVKPLQHFEIFLYAFYFVFTYFSPRLSLRSALWSFLKSIIMGYEIIVNILLSF